MLVQLTFGSRRGEVIDFLPHEAHAMLADGRATLPGAIPAVVVAPAVARDPAPSVVATRVKHRRTR